MNHSECVRKLIEIGTHLGFHATGRSYGKTYYMGNPDCVWYHRGPGERALRKIARGDRYKYLPIVAFEVAGSETEKSLRGTLMTLQITNAAASVIVVIRNSAELKSYLKKLVGRYSFVRYRIWTEKDVDELHLDIIGSKGKKVTANNSFQQRPPLNRGSTLSDA